MGYTGCTPVPQTTGPKTCPDTTGRLDSIQGELRHTVNKLNEHTDKKKPIKVTPYIVSQDIQDFKKEPLFQDGQDVSRILKG